MYVSGCEDRLNTKQNGRAEWEEKHAGSAWVYTGVLKSQPSNKKLSDHMAYDDLCATIGTSKNTTYSPAHVLLGLWVLTPMWEFHKASNETQLHKQTLWKVNSKWNIHQRIHLFFFLSETRAFIFILQIGKNKTTKSTQCLCLPAKGIKK